MLIGGRERREPTRDPVGQIDAFLFDQHQQKRGHERLRDPADAKVHVGGGGHGRHRVAERQGQEFAVVHPQPEQDRLRPDRPSLALDDRPT